MKKIVFLIGILPLFLFAQPGYHLPWDTNYFTPKKNLQQNPQNTFSIAAKGADKIIRFHQNYLSPTCGPRSNFRPTSSRYMQLAISRYGFLKGFIMGCDRLLRENEEKWIYPLITIDNVQYKYDPAIVDKSKTIR